MTITADDLTYCRELVRREQYPFYLISLFTPAATRHAWWVLLAFQAELAKIYYTVTNPLAGQIRLQWWRDCLVQIANGITPAHPVIRALVIIIQKFKLPLPPFEILIDAHEDDFGEPPIDAVCFANYGRATTVPLLQLLLACEGLDAPTQGKWFPWVDATGTQWGQLQALKIWPHFIDIILAIGGEPVIGAEDNKPYLTLLAILFKAEQLKLKHGASNIKKVSQGHSFGTLIKLWWTALHIQRSSA